MWASQLNAVNGVERNFGEKIKYDPQWTGPLETQRKVTNFPVFILFVSVLSLWIGLGIYVKASFDKIPFEAYFEDWVHHIRQIREAKYIAIGFTTFAGVITVPLIILLQRSAKTIIYTGILVICNALFLAICIFSYIFSEDKTRLNILFWLLSCVAILILIIIIVLSVRKKIVIACEVIGESSRAVMSFPLLFLFPVILLFLYAVTVIFFLEVVGSLLTIPPHEDGSRSHIYAYHAINLIGFLWTWSFAKAFVQMVLCGSYATWFWTFNKQDVPTFTVIQFIKITLMYHLGTIALGSFILSICEIISSILRFIRQRIQKDENSPTGICFACYSYVFLKLESLLEYLNRDVYIMTAVHATDFMQSARDAFNLLMRNVVKVIVITKVTDIILSFGLYLVIGISLLSTYAYCYYMDLDQLVPYAMTMVGIGSLVVTSCFFTIPRAAIDTIFLCVMEDFERNDGSIGKPYYMSSRLKELLFS
ncbi:hypothetical protein QAD02_016713 [Eretmocerus hayati]|uniref:Uncharacterized protein n=1 Tax=Eretmocerus hayati TaxID=131215 RepID=A0ACC2PD51_9HYME|nr:hypothetical protein QAD02_016713 [Eretmocerus hayati]